VLPRFGVVDVSPFLERVLDLPSRGRQFLERQFSHVSGRDHVEPHEFDRGVEAVGVLPLVHLVKIVGDPLYEGFPDGAVRERDLHGMGLVLVAKTAVAQELHLRGSHRFLPELVESLFLEGLQALVQLLPGIFIIQLDDAGLDVVSAQVGHEHAPGREHGRLLGYDDLFDPQFPSQGAAVHSTSATEGDHGEIPRIMAAVD